MTNMRFALLTALAAAVACPLSAQQVYTAKDYAQAERWMVYGTAPLVHHTISGVEYLPDGRVFYKDPGKAATMYYLADPAKGARAAAFDNAKLAGALTEAGKAAKVKYNADKLNLSNYKVEPTGFSIDTRLGTFHCDATATKCHIEPPPPEPVEKAAVMPTSAPPTETGATTAVATAKAKPAAPAQQASAAAMKPTGRRGKAPINMSPDGKQGVFIRDNNLWVRTIATGDEKQLTFDGIEDFGYATDNAGWQHSDAAIATWSKDGRYVATFQQDQRKTGMMYLVPVTNRHPVLEAWRYPLVGDKDVTMIEPVVIDVAAAKIVRLQIAPLQHRSMECDDVSCDGDGRWSDVDFSGDDANLAFVSTSRDHKDEWVKIADTATGVVRDVYHEHVPTYYGWQAKTDWKVLWGSKELLWVSERSNWAQVYLYDLTTGKLKNEVTHGDGPVWDLLHVDEAKRVLYFSATDKEPDVDPYYTMAYSVGLDGSGQTLLTPEKMEHQITWSRDGATFVDIYSTVAVPQTAVIRDTTGKVLLPLGKQDISELLAAGWKPPTRFSAKARDGKTDVYGYFYQPTNFDAAKKYPVADYIYPGPQDAACTLMGHGFAASRADMQSLAELGFITLCVDGMGNPHRSKSFHDAHASRPEDMGDDTVPDQVSAIKELAAKYPWMDATRVGIWGHSGGGNATVSAMFHFPEFFKVGWAESGNHDNRDYEDDWDERWAGLEVIDKDGKSNYDAHANQNYAKNLLGKLMMVHGTMDDNVPPSNTLLVTDALMKANRDFDLLMVPNAHHGYGEQSIYIMRRRWDYFVNNLAGGVPPKEYKLKSYAEIIKALYGDGPSDEQWTVDAEDQP
jgi:dipeptidyl-peptidase-4